MTDDGETQLHRRLKTVDNKEEEMRHSPYISNIECILAYTQE